MFLALRKHIEVYNYSYTFDRLVQEFVYPDYHNLVDRDNFIVPKNIDVNALADNVLGHKLIQYI